MGYEKEHILTFRLNDRSVTDKISVLKEELKRLPEVINVSVSSNLPNNISSSTYVMWPGKPEDIKWMIYTGEVDHNFVNLYEIDMVKGRSFSSETGGEKDVVIINETAARALPWEEPIGKELVRRGDTCIIVGVMKDFHQHSLHQEIMPLQLFLNEKRRTVSVKVSGENLQLAACAQIGKTTSVAGNRINMERGVFQTS